MVVKISSRIGVSLDRFVRRVNHRLNGRQNDDYHPKTNTSVERTNSAAPSGTCTITHRVYKKLVAKIAAMIITVKKGRKTK